MEQPTAHLGSPKTFSEWNSVHKLYEVVTIGQKLSTGTEFHSMTLTVKDVYEQKELMLPARVCKSLNLRRKWGRILGKRAEMC